MKTVYEDSKVKVLEGEPIELHFVGDFTIVGSMTETTVVDKQAAIQVFVDEK